MLKLIYPKGTLKYILLQRTTYFPNSKIYKFLSYVGASRKIGKYTHKTTVFLKSLFFNKRIQDEYTKDMMNEFKMIEDFLPKNCLNILDIGCGIAGVDIFISKHYLDKVNVHLLDKSSVDKHVYYNFNPKTAFYSSLSLAKKFLEMNGVPEKQIFLSEADENNKIGFNQVKFDLITSFISWGFHYPVSTYFQEVYERLNNGGVLIIDLRKNAEGRQLLESKFSKIEVIRESNSWEKVACFK